MPISFKRPVGTKADIAELEYVSALLQTNRVSLRADGSLIARDVHLYLKSRHGINFSEESVQRFIIGELAGTCLDGDREERLSVESNTDPNENGSTNEAKSIEEEPKIDLVQLISLLLIPVFREHDRRSFLVKTSKFAGEIESLAKAEIDGVDFYDCNEHSDEKSMQDDTQSNIEERENDLIDLVISIILQETQLEKDVELTEENMRKILLAFREQWPDEVVKGMVEVCGDKPVLNRDTLLRALTYDTKAYDLSCQQKFSTHYQDACSATGEGEMYYSRLKRFWTAPNVDSAVDTYGSKLWTILAFFTYVTTAFSYLFSGNLLSPKSGNVLRNCSSITGVEDSSSVEFFGCTMVNAIIALFRIFFLLAVLGFLMLYFTTLGNSVYTYGSYKGDVIERSFSASWKHFIRLFEKTVLICVAIFVNTFFVYILYFNPIVNDFVDTQPDGVNAYLRYASLALGTLLFITQVVQFLRVIVPPKWYKKSTKRSCMVSGTLKAELMIKQACIFKVNKILMNAIGCHYDEEIHPVSGTNNIYNHAIASINCLDYHRSAVSDALLRHTMKENLKEIAGGVKWTVTKLRDGTLFSEEGLWLFPRLVTANFVQWLVALAFLFALLFLRNWIAGILQKYFPDDSESIHLATVVGFIPAFISATNVALTYIPSAFSTILKHRSGFRPCLKDHTWLQHRYAMDTVNIMFAAALWATIFSGLIIFALTFFVTLTIVSSNKEVRQVFDLFYPALLAILLYLCMVAILLRIFRKNMYRGFMRQRPALLNILNTFHEGWMANLSVLTIPLRFVTLLLVTFFYLGRIDTVFLAPGVGWIINKFPLDGLPIIFRRDLFLHEAHRHPYIERLGYIYLLKIGRREDFGKQVGAAWRILFTLALCPWVGKYRLNAFRQKDVTTKSSGVEMSLIQSYQSKILELEKDLVSSKRMLVEQITSWRTNETTEQET